MPVSGYKSLHNHGFVLLSPNNGYEHYNILRGNGNFSGNQRTRAIKVPVRIHMSSIGKIIAATLAGTSVMTGFSYGAAFVTGQQFREPAMLNKLINSLLPESTTSRGYGWAVHYVVGLGFVIAYHQLWKQHQTNELAKSSVALGFASGILGASVWTAVLKLHPHPPRVDRKRFLPHLVMAHLVFAFFAKRGYALMHGNNSVSYISQSSNLPVESKLKWKKNTR